MKKHLFLHLSFMGLMGLSTIAYGGWTKYGPEFKSGDPIPNGDCLEMMCQYGCVEDANGLNGTCCPNEGTNGSACTIGACCSSGKCDGGICKPSTCSFRGKIYNNGDFIPNINGCGICNNGEIVAVAKKEDCKICNETTWLWSPVTDASDKDDAGQCCAYGIRRHYPTLCPAPCYFDGVRYETGVEVNECGICLYGTIQPNASKLDKCHACNDRWEIMVKKGQENKIYFESGEEKCCEGKLNPEKTLCTLLPDKEFVCQGSVKVKKDGSKKDICCKVNEYPTDYYYSVSGSGRLGGWQVHIYGENTPKPIRTKCIGGWKKGKCGNRSSNQSINPSDFLVKVSQGEKACLYFYSNSGGSANYNVWFKKVQ